MLEVTRDPIIPDRIVSQVQGSEANGATVSFIGALRGQSADGEQIRFAECEGDEQQLREVGDEIRTRWHLTDVSLCHRVGRVGVGEVILVVAIAAPHRQEAFEACQYAVDRIKERILIREVF